MSLPTASHRRAGRRVGFSAANTRTHDFNGDGKSDIVWRDSSGNVAFWLMNGATMSSSGGVGGVPATWSIVGQRDFNGDGKADLLWRDTSGNTAMWFMNGTPGRVARGRRQHSRELVGRRHRRLQRRRHRRPPVARQQRQSRGVADERRDGDLVGRARQRADRLVGGRHRRLQRRRQGRHPVARQPRQHVASGS